MGKEKADILPWDVGAAPASRSPGLEWGALSSQLVLPDLRNQQAQEAGW